MKASHACAVHDTSVTSDTKVRKPHHTVTPVPSMDTKLRVHKDDKSS